MPVHYLVRIKRLLTLYQLFVCETYFILKSKQFLNEHLTFRYETYNNISQFVLYVMYKDPI